MSGAAAGAEPATPQGVAAVSGAGREVLVRSFANVPPITPWARALALEQRLRPL